MKDGNDHRLCSYCGHPCAANAAFCRNCGQRTHAASMYDPLTVAQWKGRAVGLALAAPRNRLILIGGWLICTSGIAGITVSILSNLDRQNVVGAWAVFLMAVAIWFGVIGWSWRQYRRHKLDA